MKRPVPPRSQRKTGTVAKSAKRPRNESKAVAELIIFNKPFGVICQFSPSENKSTLKDFLQQPGFYPAGRLDHDSEGLLLLTNQGWLQHRIAHPQHKLEKTYWVQLDNTISDDAIEQLRRGVQLKDGLTQPASATRIAVGQQLWPRQPPIRSRKSIPTSWISLTITEGRNRQVRRMTAAVGFPTLRLIRVAIGPWSLQRLKPGDYRKVRVENTRLNPQSDHSTPFLIPK